MTTITYNYYCKVQHIENFNPFIIYSIFIFIVYLILFIVCEFVIILILLWYDIKVYCVEKPHIT
jgi:hypothetical protein